MSATDALRITAVQARQVLDARVAPTVEAHVLLEEGVIARVAMPSVSLPWNGVTEGMKACATVVGSGNRGSVPWD